VTTQLTPTCVGNTAVLPSSRTRLTGSPPRAWGIRFQFGQHPRPRRFTPTRVGNTGIVVGSAWPTVGFTPTRVGNTCAMQPPRTRLPVHPHARGEYVDGVR